MTSAFSMINSSIKLCQNFDFNAILTHFYLDKFAKKGKAFVDIIPALFPSYKVSIYLRALTL